MSEIAISAVDAAKDFPRLIERLENHHESAVIVRDGHPVARLVPWKQPAAGGEELADRWAQHDRLPPEEAEAFARDLESARTSLTPLRAAWD